MTFSSKIPNYYEFITIKNKQKKLTNVHNVNVQFSYNNLNAKMLSEDIILTVSSLSVHIFLFNRH